MTFPEILTKARFYLELRLDGSVDSTDGYFMECSGFARSQDVIEICEVTPQVWGKQGKSRGHIVRSKIPGNSSYTNITIKRGLTISTAFWEWMDTIGEGNWIDQRRNGALCIYDQAGDEQFRFEFTGAWPVSYKISDLDVKGADYNIEEVEIVVESLKRVCN
ncbi:phage tail protein [Leptolyngbyaceae cyanobacterium CCMR0082]|uniref:Phage tail protein n=2 Tax=Adonisia turfae TaxID=2950184 RepID=A0A6M0SHH5_9CYAN|nr:phage tail protein [Adonisia turfae]MDV3348206.1 phage tail protein [Leptothoe sp. LEGE 181152]NEZ60414.1 phage tail protein [Adonisia turfae CCMR0081]NEZ67453.1 phage tail protein [Adonisia turfae CCMR0082]